MVSGPFKILYALNFITIERYFQAECLNLFHTVIFHTLQSNRETFESTAHQRITKKEKDLAILIPGGYLSFLLLTLLIGFVFIKIFPKQETFKSSLRFGVIFGFLFSLSNLLGLFSYIRLSLGHLIFINMGYFIEIIAVVLVYNSFLYPEKIKNKVWKPVSLFFILVIIGVIIQNIFNQT